jgi:phosphatidylinositol 3,5-bisphosphate 5-phosphatase
LWIGFVKFTAGWYLILTTKRSVVALIGGHYLYHLEGTDMLPIALNHKIDNLVEEQRLLMMFRQVDMTKNFYFSYTYDITSTLQRNLTRVGASEHGLGFVERFAWNHHMLVPAFGEDETGVVRSPWAIPIMHGHVDQASMSISLGSHSPFSNPPSLLSWSRFCNHPTL